MIGKMDEYTIHQIESTIGHAASSDFSLDKVLKKCNIKVNDA
jgi:hypothetical protein